MGSLLLGFPPVCISISPLPLIVCAPSHRVGQALLVPLALEVIASDMSKFLDIPLT